MTATTDRFCSADARSWTDIISNQLYIAGASTLELGAIARWGTSPPFSLIPSYLHETHHHVVFSSTLGTSIARLFLAAGLRASGLGSPVVDRDGRPYRQISPDVTRLAAAELMHHDVMREMLRPIVEGLALFAEFDSVNRGGTDYHTKGMYSLFHMFQVDNPLPDLGNLDERQVMMTIWRERVLPALKEARLCTSGIGRKLRVYGLPLTNGGDGYLLGYLTVKRLWACLSQRVPIFRVEPDVFLGYVSDFLLSDWKLVTVALDMELENETRFVTAVADRLRDRLRMLLKDVTNDDVVEWYRYTRRINAAPNYNMTSDEADCGRESVIQLKKAIIELARDPYDGHQVTFLLAMLQHRSSIPIWSVEVDVKIQAGQFVVRLGQEAVNGEVATPEVIDGEGPGRLDVYFMFEPPAAGRVCVLFQGGQRIAEWIISADEYQELLAKKALGLNLLDAGVSMYSSFRKAMDPYFKASRISRGHPSAELADAVLDVYSIAAFDMVPEGRLNALTEAMASFGLLGIFDGQKTVLEQLARLGLDLSVQEGISDAFDYTDADSTVPALLHELDRIRDRFGWQLYSDEEGLLLNV